MPQRFLDPPAGRVLLAHQALRVNLQQDSNTVPGPLRDLVRWDAAVELGGHRGVAEVIGPTGEGRGVLLGCQRLLARGAPDAAVGALRQLAAADTTKQPTIRSGAEPVEVSVEQRGQDRGVGTARVSPAPRCLSERRSGRRPLSPGDPTGSCQRQSPSRVLVCAAESASMRSRAPPPAARASGYTATPPQTHSPTLVASAKVAHGRSTARDHVYSACRTSHTGS